MDPFQKELRDNLGFLLQGSMEALATNWNQKATKALNKIMFVHVSWSISLETPHSL